jgi:TPP-dependent 2-oxoacid decarboxylase
MELLVLGRRFNLTFELLNSYEIGYTNKTFFRDVTKVVIVEINSAGEEIDTAYGQAIRKPCDKPYKNMGRMWAIWRALPDIFGNNAYTEYLRFMTEYTLKMASKDTYFVRDWAKFLLELTQPEHKEIEE